MGVFFFVVRLMAGGTLWDYIIHVAVGIAKIKVLVKNQREVWRVLPLPLPLTHVHDSLHLIAIGFGLSLILYILTLAP